MKRDLNLLHAWSLMTGVVIGSGIFVNPTTIMFQTGSVGLALVMWLVSGILECLLALCYCELACMFPKAGGVYAYFKTILPHHFPAFLAVWNYFVSMNPSFYAVLSLVSAKYTLKPFFPGCAPPDQAVKMVAILFLMSVVALNSVYTKHVAIAQSVFVACKILPLLIIIVVGLIEFFVYGHNENMQAPFADSNWSVASIYAALLTGSFNFGGWQCLYNVGEEIKKPEKIVPRATVLSLLSVTALYLLTNFCYMVVLHPRELEEAETVALSFTEKSISWFSVCVPFLVVTSTVGSLNGSLLGGSRMAFAAARDGLFPEAVCYVHMKYRSPWLSVWISGALSILFILSADLVMLIKYQAFTAFYIICFCLCCIVWLRWAEPNRHRPFKMAGNSDDPPYKAGTGCDYRGTADQHSIVVKLPLGILIVVTFVIFSLVIVNLYNQPRLFGFGLLFMFSAAPVYTIFVWSRKKMNKEHTFIDKLNLGLQKCLNILPEKFL